MPLSTSIRTHASVQAILGAIGSVAAPVHPARKPALRIVRPFVTFSGQSQIYGQAIAQKLADRLNSAHPPSPPWTAWDRALVEKVASDHNISSALVESLEEYSRSWLTDFLEGLSASDKPEVAGEEKVYRCVAATIRALAQVGHVILVGRGAGFITRDMLGGIHVQLVAPLPARIQRVARDQGLTMEQAETQVRQIDQAREAFLKRFFPKELRTPESYTMTLNCGQMDDDEVVACLVPVIQGRSVPTRPGQGASAS